MRLKIVLIVFALLGQVTLGYSQHYKLQKIEGKRSLKLKKGRNISLMNAKGEILEGEITEITADSIQIKTVSKDAVKTKWALSNIETVRCETFLGYVKYISIATGVTMLVAITIDLIFPNVDLGGFEYGWYLAWFTYDDLGEEGFAINEKFKLLYVE